MANQSTFDPKTAPLWQQALNSAKKTVEWWDKNIQQTKSDLKKERESWAILKWVRTNSEIKPEKAFEETAWGWNYDYNRKVSQPQNEQWSMNALQGTGHVAGIPERQTFSTPKQWERMPEGPDRTIIWRNQTVASGTNVQPTNTAKVWWQTQTVQPTVQQQPQEEDLQAKATPWEFWYWSKWEQAEQQQEPEQRPGMTEWENTEGVIYGRASGNSTNKIKTDSDPYSAEARYMEGRQKNYQNLQSMNSYDVAVSVANGYDPYGSQAMRDLSQYDPAKYQEIQWYIKQIQGEDDINNIATNGTLNKTEQINKSNDSINNSITSWVNQNSTERNASQVQTTLTNKLANSQVANSATQEMLNINAQIAEIQEKMNNLPNEARKQFKWDVPQYIVDAYVTNRNQQYQSELNKLQSRYNSAIELYKTELGQKQWEAEMELKQKEYNFKVSQQNWENTFKQNQQNWTQYYQGQQLQLSSIKTDAKGRPYVINSNGSYTYLTDDTYNMAVREQVQTWVNSLMTVWQDWMDGGQCEAFTDSFNKTVYGAEMLPRDAQGNIIPGRTYTTAQEKASYANSAIPVVGSTAIFNYWPDSNVSADAKKYWHTMVVTGYDQDTWIITLKGSNQNGDEKVYSATMSVWDFYSKRWGVGFRDPAQDSRLKADSGAVSSQYGNAMTPVFDELITNANTEGKLNTLATAEAMYNTLTEIRDNGSLNALITSGDLKKVLAEFDQKKFWADDGGTVLATQLQKIMTKKSLSPQSQIALNKLYMLVEMKLRKESGAAISSSEWYSNFQMMLPQAYESTDVQLSKLTNWDDVIRRYARTGGMRYDEYVPLFSDGKISTRQTW